MTAIDMPVLQLGQWRLHPGQTRAYQQWARGSGLIGPACECSVELGSGGCVTDMSFDVRTSVQVGTTPTLLISTGTAVGTIIIQNLGPYPITITDAAGIVQGPVLFSDGDPLVLDDVTGSLYATCPVAQSAPADTRVFGGAQGWTDPVSDLAPWIDPTAPESARFLGVFVTRIDGLDDGVTSRSMTNRVGGGGAPGATTIGPRGLRLEGLLLATDVAALEWGKRWWARRWDRPQDWSTVLGCTGAQISVHGDCSTPWLDLFDVIAPSGPAWSDTQCCGTAVAFTLDLSAGQPWLFERPVTLASGLLGDGAGATCGCGAVIIGGGFDAPFTECPACSACPDAPADCLVDPHVPAVTAPTWVAGATDFDEHGRPNCGPGSANFGSGAEVAWTDPSGRTSTSGHFLDTAGEQPAFDHFGAPSCGSGSAIHGAYPAAPGGTVTLFSASEVATSWVAQGTTITGLTPTQLAGLVAHVTPASGASVRNVTRQIVWRNANASPPVRAGSGLLQVRLAPTSSAVDLDGGSVMPPVGWVADVVIGWEQLITAGSVTVTATTPAVIPIPSPNGGQFPAYDPAGRPSCGPGSEHYGDEIPARDLQGRPSCGSGSATYGAESPIPDWAARPLCGTGSANYQAGPAAPAGTLVQLVTPAWDTTGSEIADLDIQAAQVASLTWHWRSTGAATTANTAIQYLYHRASDSQQVWSPVTVVAAPVQTYPPSAYGDSPEYTAPALPADCAPGSPVKVRFSVELSTPGIPVIGFATFGAASAIAGPNAGTDRACAPSPNGGVDRPCVEGPNHGTAGLCGGTDRPCAGSTRGPNAGHDRELVGECVSAKTWTFSWFASDWASIAAPDGALPHPGDTTAAAALLAGAEGASLSGLTSPLGAYVWRLYGLGGAFIGSPEAPPTNLLCDGSRILSARLVVKFTPPSGDQAATLWPGWTLQAVSTSGVAYGGWRNTTIAPEPDEDGFHRIALDLRTITELSRLNVIAQLAAPTGGTAGSLDYIAVEAQYVGGAACKDCGPNNGVDVPCPDSTISAPTVPGWADPADPVVRCETVVPPSNADAVSVLTFTAPAGQDLRAVKVQWFANPTGLPCPSASPSAAASWACTTPLATALIPRVPAGSTLTISGAGERVTVTCDGVERDATGLVFAPVGAFRWPILTGRTCVCITADSCSGATATASFSSGYAVRHAR